MTTELFTKAEPYEGMKQEVARRHLAEEARRASEELQARIIASSRDCIKVLNLEGPRFIH